MSLEEIDDIQERRAIERTLAQFDISQETIQKGVAYFIKQMEEGLSNETYSNDFLPMIPSFITHIPDGSETGLSLAADLGGTNFRICSVNLNGDHTFDMEQFKRKVDTTLMNGEDATSEEFFAYLARQVRYFLNKHHKFYLEKSESDLSKNPIKMSFTFSFPINQTSIDKGTLIRWTKGYNIPDAVGKDVVTLFQYALDEAKLPVKIVAITNDTVGTLLANSYSTLTQSKTVLGAIFGTGTNGAYPEKLENIKKLDPKIRAHLESKGVKDMIINTEWGSFDNKLEFLPTTIYDETVDSETSNAGVHLFEKRISGMFLGEIVRLVILDLHRRKLILNNYELGEDTLKNMSGGGSIRKSDSSTTLISLTNYPRRPNTKRFSHLVYTEWSLSTENLSRIQVDDSTELSVTELVLEEALHINTTYLDRLIIKKVTNAVSQRAALLASIAIAAVVLKTGRTGLTLSDDGQLVQTKHNDEIVEVGVDGAVVEFYPGFRKTIIKGLKLTQLGEQYSSKIEIVIAKDGSGVGAALCTKSYIE